MAKISLRDLRITYRTLQRLPADEVPSQLIVTLAEMIKQEERHQLTNKISRMSEEDLIRYQDTPRRRLRIDLPDGRIIQQKTNELTFWEALREAGPRRIALLDITLRQRPFVVAMDPKRKQLNGYKALGDGCFVLRSVRPDERLDLLRRLDAALQLGWDIRLV